MNKIISTTFFLSLLLFQNAESKKAKSDDAALTTYMDTISYVFGLDIGSSLSDFKGDISISHLVQGLQDKYNGKEVKFTPEQVKSLMQKYSIQMREKKLAQFKMLGEKNLIDGKKFLEENKKKEGVIVTESGLQYIMLTEGSGLKVKPGNEVKFSFIGTFIDGIVFEKSGQPVEMIASEGIKGWVEVLQLMKSGSKCKVFIPSELAYGETGRLPDIPPHTVLIYEIELLEIVE